MKVAIALPRLHPGCSPWLPMGPVTDDLRPLPHLSLLLPPTGTSNHKVGGSFKKKQNKTNTRSPSSYRFPLGTRAEWSRGAVCSQLSIKGKHPSFLPRAKSKWGPTVLPHISAGLDPHIDSCALLHLFSSTVLCLPCSSLCRCLDCPHGT